VPSRALSALAGLLAASAFWNLAGDGAVIPGSAFDSPVVFFIRVEIPVGGCARSRAPQTCGFTGDLVAVTQNGARTLARGVYADGTGGEAAVAPDSRRVAFVSNRSGFPAIWLARLDAAEPVRITRRFTDGISAISPDDGTLPLGALQWTPRGDRLVFRRFALDDYDPASKEYFTFRYEIWTVELQTGRPTAIVKDDGISAPVLSPDGSKIAYTEATAREDLPHHVHVVSVSGQRLWTAAMRGAGGFNEPNAPVWLPRGDRLAYDDGNGKTTIRTDGGRLDGRFVGAAAAWSPSGRVAFVREGALYVGRGRSARVLRDVLIGDDRRTAAPSGLHWSPDGKFVAVPDPRPVNARVVSADGPIVHVVSRGARAVGWSAEGRLLLATARRLFVARRDGSRARMVATAPRRAHIYWAAWSR
jgi:WD40 repeat protein